MNFEEIEENKLSPQDTLWRYLTFHKFLFLIQEKKLFFNRLDLLPDPFEGITMKLIQERKIASLYPEKENWNPKIPLDVHEENYRKSKETLKKVKDESEILQKSQYVNCWFKGNRESMAMWTIYSDPDSVAIKINGRNFIDYLKRLLSLQPYMEQNLKLIFGAVDYMELNPVNLLKESNVKYSGLKKDVSYAFEEEYRLLLLTPIKSDVHTNPPYKTLDLTTDFLKTIKIVTHPLMESWKFSNIQRLCNLLEINNISPSKIEIEK